MSKSEVTTIRISKTMKTRLESLVLYGETHQDAVLLLLWLWMNPKRKGSIQPHSRQTIMPPLTSEENAYVENLIQKQT